MSKQKNERLKSHNQLVEPTNTKSYKVVDCKTVGNSVNTSINRKADNQGKSKSKKRQLFNQNNIFNQKKNLFSKYSKKFDTIKMRTEKQGYIAL